MGVTMIEQLAHALENVLDDLQRGVIEPTTELFTACYRAIDAIQVVQKTYEGGELTPPAQALQALANLEQARSGSGEGSASASEEPAAADEPARSGATRSGAEESRRTDTEAGSKTVPATDRETASEEVVSDGIPSPLARGTDSSLTAEEEDAEPIAPVSGAVGVDGTIRVSVSKLDALMAQLSELLVTKIRAEQRLAQVHHLREFMVLWQKEWTAVRSAYSRLARQEVSGAFGMRNLGPVEASPGQQARETVSWEQGESVEEAKTGGIDGKIGKDISALLDYVGVSQNRLREVSALINDLSREYANDTMHMSLVIDELEQEIKRVRMLPLSTITGAFGRMVRDLAQESGKEAVLRIVGGETELDKRVLEQIKDPLIHLLRNAVDHGVELPERRLALGKPRAGTVTLSAEQLGNDVVISVSDDGAGLDMEAIRKTIARRSGVDASALSEEDLKEAIFNVGVSTTPIITDISGRGVGLDVVRRNVEALHGRIEVEYTPGKGTSFTLILPLTLTSSRGLLVRAAGEVFTIPHNAIEYIRYVRPSDISPLEGHDVILYNGRPLALVRLADVLALPHVETQRDDDRFPVVILAAAERRMAFAVDELAGEQEVVIKSLGRQLSRVGGIAGATVMGNGEVVLILNVSDLIKLGLRGDRRSVLATLAKAAPAVKKRARRRILVVDDSITTRTLEKNILEAAGYEVRLAIDGEEALNAIATEGVPDLVVSDVVMPRLDGFDLTKRIKEDPNMGDVPVILVTSLDSSEDKTRGIEVGADAYITKSSFDQNNLLETIEQLI